MRTIDPTRVQRIVVRATNWVGDAVMSVPALREIRRIFPQAHISLVVRPWVRDVYAAVDFADALITFDKRAEHRGALGLLRFARALRRQKFDLAILLQNAFEAALMAWLARVPLRVGYARDGRSFLLTHPCPIDPSVRSVHQAFYYLGILSAAGWLEPAPWENPARILSASVGVSHRSRSEARQLLRSHGAAAGEPLVGFNPGAAYGGAKRWPVDRFAAVADRLAAECGSRIVVFGSPDETAIAQDMAARMAHPPIVLAGRTTLDQLMALLRECRLFITNDSGPMHLAAALDVPQIAIFGSTSEVATGPLSSRARVVKNPVDCSPCFLRECPIDFRCMTGVSVDHVYAAAREVLRRDG